MSTLKEPNMTNGKSNGNGSSGAGFDLKQIEKIIKLVEESQISGLTVESDNLKIDVRKEISAAPQMLVSHHAPALPVSAAVVPTAAPVPKIDDGLVAVKSPMVGTFYASPSPDAEPFVKVGSAIKKGDTVCVIEAMKLFNEIEAELSGVVEKILVENAQGVEYGQELLLIRLGS